MCGETAARTWIEEGEGVGEVALCALKVCIKSVLFPESYEHLMLVWFGEVSHRLALVMSTLEA